VKRRRRKRSQQHLRAVRPLLHLRKEEMTVGRRRRRRRRQPSKRLNNLDFRSGFDQNVLSFVK